MTTTALQVKLRGIFLLAAGDSPENPTNSSASDIFSNIISTITNIFHSLITWFNQEFPPESRDEQIRRWTTGATPYLVVACVLITLLCCWCCLFSCIVSIFSWFFQCVYSILSCLFNAVMAPFRCLCCGLGRRMKAPGRPGKTMLRSDFEADPRGYFRDLRGNRNF